MKVTEYRPDRPIILGDFGLDREPKKFKQLSEEELLAMQPASTQELMKMKPGEAYIIKDNWKAEEIKIEEVFSDNGEFLGLKVKDRFLTAPELDQYRAQRITRIKKHYARRDKTPLIHPDNVNGIMPNLSAAPEWRKDMVISKLQHNTEVQAIKENEKTTPKELWKDMNWMQAMWHWISGGEIRKEEEREKTRPWQL